jgi:hypothetical protein
MKVMRYRKIIYTIRKQLKAFWNRMTRKKITTNLFLVTFDPDELVRVVDYLFDPITAKGYGILAVWATHNDCSKSIRVDL